MEHPICGKRILVSGAKGFLGTNLSNRLLSHGAEVHGTSRIARSGDKIFWHKIEWSSADQLEKALHGIRPDVIVHLAGHVSALPDPSLVVATFQSLLTNTIHLLQAATNTGVPRVIVTGSTEESWAPNSPYAAAKSSSSLYCQMFHRLYGTPVINVRPAMTFGPYQGDQKLVPYIIRSALEGHSPKLSSCNRRADWIYVNDVIDGFVAAITAEGIEGMTFELGTGQLRTTRSVVEALLKVLGNRVEPLFGAIDDRPDEDPRPALTGMSKRRLRWTATTPFDRAIYNTVSWYIRNRYVNVPHAAANASVKLHSSFPFTIREGNFLA